MSATKRHPFACIILAAGAGSRFGEPKVGAEWTTGVRFIDQVAQLATWTGADPIIAVVPPGVAVPDGVRAVINADAKGEQVASLRLALAQLTSSTAEGALVWPVDHPAVRVESALAVLDAARRTDAAIVVPTQGGRRGHPTWFHRSTWRELVTVKDGGARAVVQADPSRVVEVAVDDAGVHHDIDTQGDLVAARGRTA